MKCPRCAAPCADAALECAACGVLFSKWKELKEKERRAAEEALAKLAADPDEARPPSNPWVWRMLALGIAVAWSSALATYYLLWSRRQASPPEPTGIPAGVPTVPR